MKSYEDMDYHPTSEKLVDILAARFPSMNPLFFRVMVSYYWCVMASMMRTDIVTMDRGSIPVNMYSINLAPSGMGKGYTINFMEGNVLKQFQNNFLHNTFAIMAETELPKLANTRALRKGHDPDEELEDVQKEFKSTGHMTFSFGTGTEAAVRQIRHKLLMAKAGSINLMMDELGSNLEGNLGLFNLLLELYDVGKIKEKILKNSNENNRYEEIGGCSPTNMVGFGTPSRLLNGSRTEDEFHSLLDTGYARRCIFGFSLGSTAHIERTPQEELAARMNTVTASFVEQLSNDLADYADLSNMNKQLHVSEPVTLLFIEYELACKKKAASLPDYAEVKRTELSHRHFKALKLAGAYAFIDASPEILEEHAYYAIKVVEDSGEALAQILTRDKAYVKLAKYIGDVQRPVTQADLVEDLPFYRGHASAKAEMMNLAVAYGYQNNILIKRSITDNVEFIEGSCLKETDLDNMIVSYSTELASDYHPDTAEFKDLHKLTQKAGMHWCNHHFREGHRSEDRAIPGFNMVVLDVDGGVTLESAKMLLKDYKALFYTTKSHSPTKPCFRIILPTNYKLELDSKDFKDFMRNLFNWLPFPIDEVTGQRNRKWLSHNGHYEYQDGQLLDVLPFIPKTSKNDDFKATFNSQQSLNNLERWIINNTGDGNRNNMILRYALVLVDAGHGFDAIRKAVLDLNQKLPESLDEFEILNTIMVTVNKQLSQR